ncbi:GntR family transcriptional regulator [Acidimangrovimonas sediminis]|uniref:GntR family transcriptional regulator n=1 Tax=Acidimangrovimonas sediminis TaxID=2056283 RepID=UPI001E64CB45|nr:GntR family transcriptional regulator [Acidimangrovimonas sediminis]
MPSNKSRRIPVSEQIYQSLRARIVRLVLQPGESLNRQQIAEGYRVSQSPVRDAFLRLEQEGLIEIFPQSRTIVTPIDIHHARETQFLRLGLELEICRTLAAKRDPSLLAQSEQILLRQRQALDINDLERFASLDFEFHLSLCDAVGHAALWHLISDRSGHIDRLRQLNLPDPGKPATILNCHSQILDGIRAGNLGATEAAVREHLSGTLQAVRQIMALHPGYF